jgi:hypothetical protein
VPAGPTGWEVPEGTAGRDHRAGAAEASGTAEPNPTKRIGLVGGGGQAAPSIHNTQPWRFGWDGTNVELHADWSRHLPAVDPDGRQRVLSCGAALFQARLALRNLGRRAEVEFVDSVAEGDPIARIDTTAAEGNMPDLEEWALMSAVADRRTTRNWFDDTPLPPSLLADLAEAVRAEGAELVDDEGQRRALAQTLVLADRAERASPRYRQELAEWTRSAGADAPDGVPQWANGPRSPVHEPGEFVQRDFGAAPHPHAPPERPTVLVLGTKDDEPRSVLRGGMALARLLLGTTSSLDGSVVPEHRVGVVAGVGNGRGSGKIDVPTTCPRSYRASAVPPDAPAGAPMS